MSDHEHEYAGPDNVCHICGAEPPEWPETGEAIVREVEKALASMFGADDRQQIIDHFDALQAKIDA